MTLHKQLRAAFRPAQQLDIEYKDQADRPEEGYFWKQVDFALVLNPSGDVINLERPPWRLAGKRRPSTLLVPHMPFLSTFGLAGFLWGRSAHAVGVGRSKLDDLLSLDPDGFHRFRAFHRTALAEANNPSIRAFLLFLDRWEPRSLEAVKFVHETAGATVAFRFQYENAFLHECQVARQRWARLLDGAGNASGAPKPSRREPPSSRR